MSNYIYVFFLILLFSDIISIEQESDFTMEYYYSLRVANKKDLNFLLDTSISNSIYFNDPNKLGKELLKSDSKDLSTSIEINTHYIKRFNFDISNDNTKLNNSNLQGIIGLGIKDSSNSLLDKMKEEKLIKKRIVYFSTLPYPKIEFQIDIPKNSKEIFTGCNITTNSDFQESWNCDLSHIYIEDKEKDKDDKEDKIELNDTIEVNSQVIFDAKSYYITTSMKYLEEFLDEFENEDNCSKFPRNGFTYIQCNMNENDLKNLPYVSFVFDGYAYKIKPEKLFMESQKGKYVSLIRFSDKSLYNDIWIMGYPFFASYKIKFDYDNKFIGFNGEKPLNFTEILEGYNSSFFNNKTKLYTLIGVCSFILLLIIIFIIRRLIKGKDTNTNSKLVEEVQNQLY